jgi:hypothetical protein
MKDGREEMNRQGKEEKRMEYERKTKGHEIQGGRP